jgi:transposase
MKRDRRSFSLEFKLEAVRLVVEGGRPIVQVARELKIQPDQLREWRRKFESTGAVKPAPRHETPEEEARRLRKELEVVRQERDFLKKAAAFFAKGSA